MCSVKTNVVLSGFPLTMAITYQLIDYSGKKKLLVSEGCGYPRILFLVKECFNVRILAVRKHADKDECWCEFASIRINDCCRTSSPVNLYLLSGLAAYMHGSAAFLLILLDVVAELRVHEMIFTGKATFLQILSPKQLLVYAVFE